jgi:hypothetical protein
VEGAVSSLDGARITSTWLSLTFSLGIAFMFCSRLIRLAKEHEIGLHSSGA